MAAGILLIIGCYVLAALTVQACYDFQTRTDQSDDEIHFIIKVKNHDQVIEWVIRSILIHSWLKGRAIQFHFMDKGSSDTTRQVIQRLMNQQDTLVMMPPEPFLESCYKLTSRHVMHVDLTQQEWSFSKY